jgi:hypothetical protein
MRCRRLCSLLLSASLLLGTVTLGTASEKLARFTAFDYFILPDWCEVVLAVRNNETISEMKLGDVLRVTDPGGNAYGYRCKIPGHGGASIKCEHASLMLVIFGLNIEGEKEKKISMLCVT